ncbi:hypothetical protein BGZ49_001233 [Haplosporangium sp. Z 27]|nr:hypothetical protein BGZ49_001233 [Haplosporangium sp. Z 27]
MKSIFAKYPTNCDKLVALYFVSFLQQRLEEHQWDFGDDQEANKILDVILKQFGLRLSVPFQSSTIDMLDNIAGRTTQSDKQCENSSNPRKNPPLKMMVNYSRFFGDFIKDWRYAQFTGMIQLRELPENMHSNDSRPDDNTSARNETECSGRNENERHSLHQQLESHYTDQLRNAFSEMRLHFDFESITSIDIDTADAQKYLPLSTKMAKLQHIYLSGKREMPESHLEKIIQFIKRNQKAFPYKHTLIVIMTSHWYLGVGGYDEGLDDPLTDLNTYMIRNRKYREKGFRYMKPLISIFEAIRKPSMMYVTNIPCFYEHAMEIETEGLKVLKDNDMERGEHGEGPERKEFLRRCDNLRELHLAVDSHDIFSWAVDDAKQSTSSSTGRSLRKLEKLELLTMHSYNSAIQAFNDAMFAFSPTLQSINLKVIIDFDDDLPPIAVKNARLLTALQLQQRPSATSIGDWPCLLPWLRAISIRLEGVASLKVGSFKQCPNLESLVFEFGCKDIDQLRPEGVAPSILPETGILLDCRWEQVEVDYTPFPIWDLPRLKRLFLAGMAAWRFDIKSLSSMKCLESFTLDVRREFLNGKDPYEHIARQCSVSDATLYTAHGHHSEQLNAIFDSELTRANGQLEPHLHFYPVWNLPRLVRLDINGMAALKFDFRSLSQMECLEILRIDSRREKLSRRELEEYISHQYSVSYSQLYDNANAKSGSTYGIFGSDPTKALVLPKLRVLSLKGPPSALFFLDLLKSFPKLESILLSTGNGMSETVRRRISRHDVSTPHSDCQDNIHEAPSSLSCDDELGNGKDDEPYLESRLKTFALYGDWTITPQDMIRLLTKYAPFIESLTVTEHGFSQGSFFKAIKDADDINQAYTNMRDTKTGDSAEQEMLKRDQQPLLGRCLRTVGCPMIKGEGNEKEFGLQQIRVEESAVFYHYGLRVYFLSCFIAVRQGDYDLVKDELKKIAG